MAGLNLNFGTSVMKREAKPISDVEDKLLNDGWKRTRMIAGGRVRYYQKSGINITAISGPLGTVIVPSGPVRGAVFGEGAVSLNQTSSIGAGSDGSKDKENVRTSGRSNQLT